MVKIIRYSNTYIGGRGHLLMLLGLIAANCTFLAGNGVKLCYPLYFHIRTRLHSAGPCCRSLLRLSQILTSTVKPNRSSSVQRSYDEILDYITSISHHPVCGVQKHAPHPEIRTSPSHPTSAFHSFNFEPPKCLPTPSITSKTTPPFFSKSLTQDESLNTPSLN